jgi:hypothetical protein
MGKEGRSNACLLILGQGKTGLCFEMLELWGSKHEKIALLVLFVM